jgi:hypothetical protein
MARWHDERALRVLASADCLGSSEIAPEAVELMREAFAQGLIFTFDIHCDMDLEPLADNPPFRELMWPKDSGFGESTRTCLAASRWEQLAGAPSAGLCTFA